ncbi:Neuroligin 4-like [Folsomia candida]|uniref:Neuroligin 4-like n=1 Tax=Folsomia candida TaxID=158441 RepID=A0A226DLH7_FOLCA|nr:Neuroligin 4-like [Folsomia candida]
MRAILLLLSVITISCQKVNHNSTATHVLPVPLAQNGGGVEGEGEQPPFVGEGKGSPISFEGTGGTGTSSNSGPTRSRIVETKYGKVQGISVTIAQGRHNPLKNKIVYVGIPYASPPIKSHRFGPTQTALPWDGVKDAVKPGFVCPQMLPDIRNETAALKEMPRGYLEYLKKVEPYLRNQSEDCLFLNIYSPSGEKLELYPFI